MLGGSHCSPIPKRLNQSKTRYQIGSIPTQIETCNPRPAYFFFPELFGLKKKLLAFIEKLKKKYVVKVFLTEETEKLLPIKAAEEKPISKSGDGIKDVSPEQTKPQKKNGVKNEKKGGE